MAAGIAAGAPLASQGCVARGFEVAGASCAGIGHGLNEDRFRIFPGGFCVIDGIGRGKDGEVFAELAANRVQALLEGGASASRALVEADRSLADLRRWVLGSGGGAMGCACGTGSKGGLSVACLGDVRAFLVGGEVCEVCRAESPTCDRGYLGAQEPRLPNERELTRSELFSRVLMVCSDGFWRFAGAADLVRTLEKASSLESAACRLVRLAQGCASTDDITVVLCRPLTDSRQERI